MGVLDVHGDPNNEKDWRLRGAWLGPTGRLWLDATSQNQEQIRSETSDAAYDSSGTMSAGLVEGTTMDGDISKHSTSTLYLGGTPVTDLGVLKVEAPSVVETLNGNAVYAMLIVLPGAR